MENLSLTEAATSGSLSLVSRLQPRLHQLDVPISSIPVLNSAPLANGKKPRPAAVLIPIHSAQRDEPSILLTVRSHRLQHHPGQIAFPGGAADSGDGGPAATAVREAWEEVGMPKDSVRPLGYLDRLDTISGYRVVPVIAEVQDDYVLRLDPAEVDSAFHLPLATAIDRSAYHFEQREHQGQKWRLPVLQYGKQRIWGATAIMLWRMCSMANRV